MMGPYRPEVGDTVRLDSWEPHHCVTVTAVGVEAFLAHAANSSETLWHFNNDWIKVETPDPLPDRWFGITADGLLRGTWDGGMAYTVSYGAAALIHIWTDEHGVDRAEVVRTT